MWNHYSDTLQKASKTTNCTEGWHNSVHPGMWTLFNGIQKDIAIQKLVITNNEQANGDKPQLKYEKLAQRLQSKVETYPDKDNKLKYIRAVAHMS